MISLFIKCLKKFTVIGCYLLGRLSPVTVCSISPIFRCLSVGFCLPEGRLLRFRVVKELCFASMCVV
nr:MAG TPA: hypothetical protein [Caudoviricetes sp.]